MKKLGLILTIVLVLVGALVISDNASGPANPAKIVYLDIQKVLESTEEWQDLNKSYQEDFAFYQKQLDNLTKEYQDMVKSGASSTALATKQQEILTKKAQYEQTLQQTYNSKTQVILDQIKKRIEDYASFYDYDLILSKDSVVYGNGTYDITDMVIEYLKGF
ncbi:molecular chaperone Skp [Kosmotoga arenicorallina S304]|uniref:Molecular chaperone Skp n=1 Tax=Kosmotoga arenicorallina S304 TaxID=1453497 RepID=A0A176K0V3_9BACT|nr:OmpH family outer membrane protein [Kosmotoga arenicorallina]OAA30026.1 molecular chaperone Skp [Kosmotoga arenicorallina S304]